MALSWSQFALTMGVTSAVALSTPAMKFVMWEPPADGWIKINTNGAAPGSPGIAACVVLFRNPLGDFLGGFAHHMGISFAL
ncbi:putative ribonuclease H protein [Glycine max]|nr:putative ribonuclease H protein [Glycine max]